MIEALLLAACDTSLPQSTLDPHSDLARSIQSIYVEIFWIAMGILAVVGGLLVFAIVRFRRRPGDQELPSQVDGDLRLEIAWTIVPVLLLALIAVPTVRTIFATQADPGEDALEVEVVGHQWWWEYRYPASGVVTANELHLPVGRRAVLRLRSADVIHSFWVPRLGGKRDMIPGRVNTLWFTPSDTGVFAGQCAELCGLSHALMRTSVIVESPDDFQAWTRRQLEPASPPAGPLATRGAQVFLSAGCIACHRIAGTPAQGRIGPDLTHLASRRRVVSESLDNDPEHIEAWLHDPRAIEPGSRMPRLPIDEADMKPLVAYLSSLQ